MSDPLDAGLDQPVNLSAPLDVEAFCAAIGIDVETYVEAATAIAAKFPALDAGPRDGGLRATIEAVLAEHADPDADNTHFGGDALLRDIRAALGGPRNDKSRWLRCSSCDEPVPERDATVICIECGEGMVFTANAAARRDAAGKFPAALRDTELVAEP